MRIDAEELRRHYRSLSSDALLVIERADLTEVAQRVYDEEIAHRGLAEQPQASPWQLQDELYAVDADGEPEEPESEFDLELDSEEPPPDWLEDAACACAFAVHPGSPYAEDVARARSALRAARIPCHIVVGPAGRGEDPSRSEYSLMVPGVLASHATSVLDRDVFNEGIEADWRTHLEMFSDDELRCLKPEIFCAGLLDRAQRLKRAYDEEVARRSSK